MVDENEPLQDEEDTRPSLEPEPTETDDEDAPVDPEGKPLAGQVED